MIVYCLQLGDVLHVLLLLFRKHIPYKLHNRATLACTACVHCPFKNKSLKECKYEITVGFLAACFFQGMQL